MSYRIVGLDCETTGLNGEVVEVGIAIWSAEPQQLHTYCKPDQPIPLDAMVIHGITNNKVKDAHQNGWMSNLCSKKQSMMPNTLLVTILNLIFV